MTARDLLQQRYTLPNGDTAWRPSPLVSAAMEGKLLLLDGIHRVNQGTLAVLSRCLQLNTYIIVNALFSHFHSLLLPDIYVFLLFTAAALMGAGIVNEKHTAEYHLLQVTP